MATAKIATKECVKCHCRRPANEMKKKIVEKKTGSSIGVYGLGKGGKPKASGRVYYRKSEVWICKACQAKPRSKIGKFFRYILYFFLLIFLITWLF